MRLEDDETLVDPADQQPLKDWFQGKKIIKNLNNDGIHTVEDFMNITDWSTNRFPSLKPWLLRELKRVQNAKKVQDEWRARFRVGQSTGIHFTNPYVIARVAYT